MKRLTLIMPVFNAKATLGATIESVLKQISPEIEFIIVDDGSTDGSSELLDNYSASDASVRIIHQGNQGAAAARDTAIDEASGEYLGFVDADDAFPEGSLGRILNLTENGSDIIGWDWTNEVERKLRPMRQADYTTPEEALKNLMGGTMKWNLWLFAVKRKLVNDNAIRFIPGADMGEDMAFMLKAFACAGAVLQVHESLYLYNASNPASISNRLNGRRREEVTRNLSSAESFLSSSRHSGLCRDFMPHLKLYIKRPLLISLSKEDYATWHGWFPDANSFATANRALPLRIRLLQWMAKHKLWTGVRIYNIIVYKVLSLILH